MSSICFYFQVHQPFRIKKYRHSNIGSGDNYYEHNENNDLNNEWIMKKVAQKSYLPTNALWLHLLNIHPELKISYSISGVALEQFEAFAPKVIESFQKLVDTGRVELLGETYYHSLSFIHSKLEFARQVEKHNQKILDLFGFRPRVFRNTELIYNNDIAHEVEKMGYEGILMEGADSVLGWRSPNFVYHSSHSEGLKLLLKNYKLSDDIAFRFSSREWKEYPLTADKFANWIHQINGNGQVVNLFMDYETFGEHQWEETGIFDFLKKLPEKILEHPDNDFVTPSEALERYSPVAGLDVPNYVSWADVDRDLSAWLENPMQQDALRTLFEIEENVYQTKDSTIIEDWRRMTTSDHFYYMCTKWFADGDVHAYFNPYESPYDAYRYFMNALTDLRLRVDSHPAHAKINSTR